MSEEYVFICKKCGDELGIKYDAPEQKGIGSLEQLDARQVLALIANAYVEKQYERVKQQRNEHMEWCRRWLDANPVSTWKEKKEQYE